MPGPAKILVVDDNEMVRSWIRALLIGEGYLVDEAGDGAVGMQRAKASCPDLILTDIVMPNKEGIEMISDLRQNGHTAPIIAMSGGGRLEGADVNDIAGKLGANACVAKPLRRDDLLAKIRACLAARPD